MRTRFAAVAAVLLLSASPARADYNVSSVQGLIGTGFDDKDSGNVTSDGRMGTITLDNSLAWKYGDQYLFLDLVAGRFGDSGKVDYALYAEWQPRLSLSRITGHHLGVLFLDDLLIAGEVNRGPGFNVLLGGLGTNLKVPGFRFWLLNVYARNDNFNAPTYQVTTSWSLPFDIVGVGLSFDGFLDLYGTDATPWNVYTQPQLLVDVGALAGLPERHVQLGTEFWIHRTADHTTVAPQAMVKLTY